MFGTSTYLVMELAWALPVLALQWAAGWRELWRARRRWALATLIPTVYLCLADRLAISDGIWRIHEDRSTGVKLAGLPLEEAVFFLLTNLMVVQALILFQSAETRARVRGWLTSLLRLAWRLARRPGARAAAAGYRRGMLAALAVALASTAAAAALTRDSLLEPVAQLVMQLTPVPIASVLIQHLGVTARPLALMGALAVLMALGGLLGALAGAAVAAIAAARRPHSAPARGHTRRRALADTAVVLGGAGTIAGVSIFDAARRDRLSSAGGRTLFPFQPPAARAAGFPEPGQAAEVTPVPQFYVVSKNAQDPFVDASLWRLRVDGLVQRPVTLAFDELLALPRTDEHVTFQCVSNPVGGSLMSSALWSGASLRALLERAGPLPAAGRVVFSAPDGHEESVPLDLALRADTLVAYAMNGELLTRLHGHPARAVLPGLYGFKQVKWLTHVRLAPHDHRGYWPRRGWTDTAAIRTTARIDVARAEGGSIRAAGMALAGRRGISSVEARLLTAAGTAGQWTQAELHAPPLSNMTWVQWRLLLPPPAGVASGDLRVEARAVDGDGVPQEVSPSGPFPNGSSGYHRVVVKA
jgi:lycopene cyclase domain-containing protein